MCNRGRVGIGHERFENGSRVLDQHPDLFSPGGRRNPTPWTCFHRYTLLVTSDDKQGNNGRAHSTQAHSDPGIMGSPLKPSNINRYYGIKRGPQLGPYYAEKCEPLREPMTFFPSGYNRSPKFIEVLTIQVIFLYNLNHKYHSRKCEPVKL